MNLYDIRGHNDQWKMFSVGYNANLRVSTKIVTKIYSQWLKNIIIIQFSGILAKISNVHAHFQLSWDWLSLLTTCFPICRKFWLVPYLTEICQIRINTDTWIQYAKGSKYINFT